MEENELKQDEVQENEVEESVGQESITEENGVDQPETVENEPKVQEKPSVDWEKRNFGAKSRDIALIGFFISPVIRSLGAFIVKTQEMANILVKIYVYLPGVIGLIGLILSIIALIKSKSKWDSIIGLILNLFVVASAVLLIEQLRMQSGY